ncbi:uncharacterized protein MYCFIDRAFT_169467 [Pseudocercospora fijiensis CIRAD86]|uniref:Putative ER transporter 6TM N-terminal domain-containing protein n=1 Tax=Pseudocercospora fijiensis (strain CIRAD86) TaxID=383855 RepID=N1Q7P9_PSEFD|nr:uncharacterized protein MYCFIDRAFT_169467 [Pseudocercospora fijiensis CIRAD86]EME87691.1 hypothetical protein MYCFIDRAFT_169467 [Pseudocercospora fijiensis CIRAD86]
MYQSTASVNLLALYCATQARAHTTAPGAPPTGYNSSASAVLAVWLIFQTYLVNSLRSALPQFQFPVIIYMIFTCVSMTYGTQFLTVTYAISFMERLLEAFLMGFALATGVSLFVIPMSCRTVVFKQMAGYLNLMGGLLKAQAAHLESLETWDPEQAIQHEHAEREKKKKDHKGSTSPGEFKIMMVTPQGKALKALLLKIYATYGHQFCQARDCDWNAICERHHRAMEEDESDLDSSRGSQLPESAGWSEEHPDEINLKARRRQIDNLHQLMKKLQKPVQNMSGNINLAFQHALIVLELTKAPKKKSDEENQAGEQLPGSPGFAEAYRKRLEDIFQRKKQTLREWCAQHEIDLPAGFFKSTFITPEQLSVTDEHAREGDQRQLFFALYIDHLLHRAGQAALELVLFADKKKQEVPGTKTLKKWAYAAFGREDYHDEDNYTADLDSAGTRVPRNAWERFGEVIRLIPRALRSDHSAFGLRVVAATMTVAIICFLRDTQTWFLRNRILWAMIMVPISMTRTAGQSTQSLFILRILGTLLAMIASLPVILHPDQIQKPHNIIGVISIVTAILIIGYELQKATANPPTKPYLLAPYRLATVCGGLAVAYIWTIFPCPVSESTELRKDIGASLYLLANLTSINPRNRQIPHPPPPPKKEPPPTSVPVPTTSKKKFPSKSLHKTPLPPHQPSKQNSAFLKIFQLRVGGKKNFLVEAHRTRDKNEDEDEDFRKSLPPLRSTMTSRKWTSLDFVLRIWKFRDEDIGFVVYGEIYIICAQGIRDDTVKIYGVSSKFAGYRTVYVLRGVLTITYHY